jgi:hypothetical protein
MDAAVDALSVEAIPGRDEFLTMAATARMLSLSAAVPKAVQDPYTAFHVVMMGRALNLDPATAINLIDVIGYDPKKGADQQGEIRLSLSPELLAARVKMMGLGSVELLEAHKTWASAVALYPGGRIVRDEITGKLVRIIGEKGRLTFDWNDALDAELVDDRCLYNQQEEVVVHWKKPGTNGRGWKDGSPNGCRCRGYKTYGQRMFAWRAIGYAVHTFFAQASLGLYSPEELGAAVDESGRAIDVSTVDLPDGYETQAAAPPEPPDPMDDPCPVEMINAVKARIAHIPEQQQAILKQRWVEKINEGRLAPVDKLTGRQLKIAGALINGAEAMARQADPKWEPWQPPEPTETASAPDSAQAPLGEAEAAVSAPEPPEGVQRPTDADLALEIESLPVELIEQAIEIVKTMTVKQLNAALRSRGFAPRGTDNEKRYRLAVVTAQEMAEAGE